MKKYSGTELSFKKTLWSFSVKLYAKPKIEEACVCLHEKYQINLNLLFFCCWLADEQYSPLNEKHIKKIIKKILPWHTRIIKPLRKLHKTFNKNQQNKKLKKLNRDFVSSELLAEQIEQSLIIQATKILEKQLDTDCNKTNTALSNIFTYLKYQNINLHKNDLEKIYRIVKICFGE
jgi:uncharacterized protein (TIGR02444 family)